MRTLLVLCFLWCINPVYGQDVDRNGAFELWTRMNIRMVTSKNIQYDFEFQYRDQQRVASLQERFRLFTFRFYIQKRWNNFFLQSSPLTFFERQTVNYAWVNEFRLTQHAGLFFCRDNIQLRTGIEGRFFWNTNTAFEELRWRTRLQVLIPISERIKIQLSDEVFLHERTSGDAVPLFDQNRLAAGVNWILSGKWSIDSGYQYQVRSFEESRTDNFYVFYLYVNYKI